MSDELHHECGVAALCWLNKARARGGPASKCVAKGNVAALMPSMLLDLQNRGQLAAGMSTYHPERMQILDTYKAIGTVSEAFKMSHPEGHREILSEYAGAAAIGHTRYATCGLDDVRYAQPFERHHGRLWKWFAFAFNGQLANYTELRDQLLAKQHYHFTLNTDTEIIMHALAYALRGDRPAEIKRVLSSLSRRFDGAWNLAFLDGMGRLFVARDPLGFRPMSYAVQGRLFAAASESTALANMGFTKIESLEPGQMAIVEDGELRFETFATSKKRARCFFEWIYFSNVASTIDRAPVYLARAHGGQRLAGLEDQPIDDSCIVVPVPDTAKAAADAFAYHMRIPCVEGLIRNRYVGRTFIAPGSTRGRNVKSKYTPLRSILEGRRVFLVEDSIVRSTTLRALASHIYARGKAKEIHVRVACPPIVAPCFYGIDMSTLEELFAPEFCNGAGKYDGVPSSEAHAKMTAELGVDSLRYLSVPDLGPSIQTPNEQLCLGCVTGKYPTKWGQKLIARARGGENGRRTYE